MEWGRFINADTLLGETGELLYHNIFAYCQGNPINYLDTTGYNKICLTDESGGSGTSSSSNKLSKFFEKVFDDVTGKGAADSTDNGKQYSTLYEASTGSGASRSAHRNAGNKEFYNKMDNDNQYKSAIDDFFKYGVKGYMKSGKGSLKNPSKDWICTIQLIYRGKLG